MLNLPFELILLFLTASFSRHEHLAEVWQDEKGNEEKDVTTEIYRGVNLENKNIQNVNDTSKHLNGYRR